MPQVIVSYDGTRNDRDALAMGRLLATAGAGVSLAYVRHAAEADPDREAAVAEESEHLLAVAAEQLDHGEVGQRVVFNRSTAEGLASLAAELGADVIAFGSGYRTPPGHVELSHTAEQLIDAQLTCSLALAPAGLRREQVERSIGTVRFYDEDDDAAARATAESLVHALGAVTTEDEADLLVIASRRDAPPGKLGLSATAREQAEQARCPVLLLAHGASMSFG
jgi:nucleotide-binding universal stress UspA family protein